MARSLILLWGIAADGPLAVVRSELQRQAVPCLFLDQQTLLDTEVELTVQRDLSGSLQVCSQSVDLAAITAAYLRPYDLRRLPAIQAAADVDAALQRGLALEDALSCWAELTSALVVNPPSAMASNNSKPYQAALIHSFGFTVPDTLVTTDPTAALAFWMHHGAVIYKSVSGVRSIVAQLNERHLDRLDEVAHCPTQFQQYIKGKDYRVHVVGDEIFACEIMSTADDYRYPNLQGAGVCISNCELPPELAERCRGLARSLRFAVAGIDLRRTDAGEWYCFEVNPSPGFTYYEAATGQPISQAVATLLAGAGGG